MKTPDRIGKRCPVLDDSWDCTEYCLGSLVWLLLHQLSELSRQSEVTVVTIVDEVG